MKRFSALLLLAAMLATMTSCGNTTSSADSGKLTVAVSILPQAAWVKAVGGDRVEVVTLIPPGSSPANYAPGPQDLMAVSRARVYFAIGVPAEVNLLPKVKGVNSDIEIVALHERVGESYPDRMLAPGQRDPHIWLSPRRAAVMVRTIAQVLAAVDSTHQADYCANAEDYVSQLMAVHQRIMNALAACKRKTFIVYHPAFGYLADDYGLEMIALEEEGKAPTPQRLKEVADYARSQGIKTVFYQAEIDSKRAEALANEIGGQAVLLEPLSPDYMENLLAIVEALRKVLVDD